MTDTIAQAAEQQRPELNRDAGDAYLSVRAQADARSADDKLARLIEQTSSTAAPSQQTAVDASGAETGVVDAGAAPAAASKDDWITAWLKRAFPSKVTAPAGARMRPATDAIVPIAKDVTKGIVEAPGAIYRGATGAAEQVLRTGDELANWLNENVADLTIGGTKEEAAQDNPLKNLADKFAAAKGVVGERTTVTGQLIEGTAQWLTSAYMTGGVSRALGIPANVWTRTINDVAAGAVGFDPRAHRISNVVESVAPNPVTEFLQANDEDPQLLARLKNGLETAGLAKIAEGVIAGLRFLKSAASARGEAFADQPPTAGAAARPGDVVGTAADPNMSAAANDPAFASKGPWGARPPPAIGEGDARYVLRQGERFVSLADGSDALGQIPQDVATAVKREPGPIRLPAGSWDPSKRAGFGELAIEGKHGAEIRAAGYPDAATMVADVLGDYSAVYQGTKGRLLVVKPNGGTKLAVLELRPDGDSSSHWTVTTGWISRPDYVSGKTALWERPRSTAQPPEGGLPSDAAALQNGDKSIGDGSQRPNDIAGSAGGGKSGSFSEDMTALERPADLQAPRGVVEISPDVAEKARAFLAGETSEAPVRVNIARMQGPEDIHAALAEISKALPEQPVTHAQTLADAASLGMSAQELVDGVAGKIFDRRQITAARIMLRSAADDVVSLAEVAKKTGSVEDRAAFEQAFDKAAAIKDIVVNQGTELGRALNAMAIEAKSDPEHVKAIRSLTTMAADGSVPTAQLIEMVAGFKDPEKVAEFISRVSRPQTTRDQIVFWWSNILLSNPSSHVANVGDTALSTLLQVPETYVASKIGDGVAAGEATAKLYGILQGTRDGIRSAARAMVTGESQFAGPAVRVEGAPMSAELARSGPVGQMGDYLKMLLPTRLMMAGDELTKAMNYRGELNRLAFRRAAIEQGLAGDALANRIGELLANPAGWLDDAAQAAAIKGTFNQELTGVASSIAQAVDGMNVPVGGGLVLPVGRVIMPFVRTPANILSWTMQRTPLGFLSPSVQADIAAGGAARDLALGRIAVGSSIMASFADLTMQGRITGAGPKDPGLRSNLMRQDENGRAQWQPYSIKIGDTWYSYSRSGTIGSLIGLAADATELISGVYSRDPKAVNMDGTPVEDGAAAAVVFPFASALLSKTYMSGLSQLLDALADPHRNGENYLQRTVSSIVPSGVAALERTIDGDMRRAQSYLEAIQSRIPGLSDSLPPRLTLWGDHVTDTNGIYNLFLPARRQEDGGYPIDKWLADAKVSLSAPSQVQPFGTGPARVTVKLTPEQHNRLIALAGNELKDPQSGMGARDMLDAMIEGKVGRLSDEWKSASDEKREIIVRDIVGRFRNAARNKLLAEDGDLQDLVKQQMQQRGEKIQAPRPSQPSPAPSQPAPAAPARGAGVSIQ